MREMFIGWFFIIGLMAIASVVFGLWVIGRAAQGLGRMLGLISPSRPARLMGTSLPARGPAYITASQSPPLVLPQGMVQCGIAGCRHVNPKSAKFCRHCGHAFPQFQTMPVRPIWT